jgi:hypothetical protein
MMHVIKFLFQTSWNVGLLPHLSKWWVMFPTKLQVALGTRAMVLHCALKECMKQSAAAGSKVEVTSTPTSLTPLVTDLLLTVQKLRDLGADSLMQPIWDQLAAGDISGSKKSTKSSKSAPSEAGTASSSNTSKQSKGGSSSAGQLQGHSSMAVRVLSSKSGRTTCAVAAVLATLHSIGFSTVADKLAQELCLSYATAQVRGGNDGGTIKDKAPGRGTSNKAGNKTGPASDAAGAAEEPHVIDAHGRLLSALRAATEAVKLKAVPLGLCPVRFQLREMGHLLVRPASTLPKDRRVGGFSPDDWQRKVLDIVDAGEQVASVQG